RFTAHHIGGLLQKRARDIDFVRLIAGRPGGRDIISRMMPDHGSNRHWLAGFRIFDELHGRANERHTAIAIRVYMDRQTSQIGVIPFPDNFFYWSIFDDFRFDQSATNSTAKLDERLVFGGSQS